MRNVNSFVNHAIKVNNDGLPTHIYSFNSKINDYHHPVTCLPCLVTKKKLSTPALKLFICVYIKYTGRTGFSERNYANSTSTSELVQLVDF